MEFELWYLILIPILFGAGWFSRSFDLKEKKSTADETKTLYKGLDLLLSDKQDQAIDSFINLVKVDPETLEMHFSLGALFRKRGEFDRAIKIHNHLINRADLSKKVHARALYELGNDYKKAGIWDRAEQTFLKLSELDSSYKADSYKELTLIYETEKEWEKAIEQIELLGKTCGEYDRNRVGHYYCELATQAMIKKDPKQIAHFVSRALEEDPQNKRALIMMGQLQFIRKDYQGAIDSWTKVARIQPDYEALVVPLISKTLIEMGDKEGALAYLQTIAEKGQSVDEVDVAVTQIAKLKDPNEAIRFIRKRLQQKPSLLGFQRLLELSVESEPENAQIKDLSNLLKKQVDKVARYQCTKCGFATRRFEWQCPGCRQWESFPPVRKERI